MPNRFMKNINGYKSYKSSESGQVILSNSCYIHCLLSNKGVQGGNTLLITIIVMLKNVFYVVYITILCIQKLFIL